MKNLLKINKISILVLFLSFTSCIVQSPKYASLDQVMNLKVGMSKAEVEQTLRLQPYDIKSITDSNNVFTYIYRTKDRRTVSFFTGKRNGAKSIGKYVQLFVTYNKDNSKALTIESCSLCPDNLVSKSTINFEKIFTFITVTAPVILVYIGLQSK